MLGSLVEASLENLLLYGELSNLDYDIDMYRGHGNDLTGYWFKHFRNYKYYKM